MFKDYMGDGVYIEGSGYDFTLTTEDGISIQNTIVIDEQILKSIVRYVEVYFPAKAQEYREEQAKKVDA